MIKAINEYYEVSEGTCLKDIEGVVTEIRLLCKRDKHVCIFDYMF
jgi:hypothetical protein